MIESTGMTSIDESTLTKGQLRRLNALQSELFQGRVDRAVLNDPLQA